MSMLTIVRHGQASLFAADYDQLSAIGQQQGRELAEWILADNLPVRMQLQLHKLLWHDEPGH